MDPQQSNARLLEISEALRAMRDSWVQLSMVLKDYVADEPSPQRDEVQVQVERHLARIREGNRRT